MIARGFKPVGWVAAVGSAALGCYMLSLNVASERAELARVEREIVAARQEIRSLQTELGTRGRLTQLEQWNADVLALSAPNSRQFVDSEFTLASFTNPRPAMDPAKVRMASADTAKVPAAKPAIDPGYQATQPAQPLVRRASYEVSAPAAEPKLPARPELVRAAASRDTDPKPAATRPPVAKPASAKAAAPRPVLAKKTVASSALIEDDVLGDISDAAKAEKKSGRAAGR